MSRPWIATMGIIVIVIVAAYALRQTGDPRVLSPREIDASVDYSNIMPDDYVGSQKCGSCHQAQYELWEKHPHRLMNQNPDARSVLGNFANATLKLPQAEVAFTTQGSDYFMSIVQNGKQLRKYKVTRTVGSRFMQFYIGVQLEGPDAAESARYREHKLPFAYWFKLKRWLPIEYFDPLPPEEYAAGTKIPLVECVDKDAVALPYTASCLRCHSTYPYAYRIFSGAVVGFPEATVAAALEPLSKHVSKTVPVEPTVQAFADLSGKLDPDKQASLGISCEACHFGGREHAELKKDIRFVPTSPFLKIKAHAGAQPITNERSNPATINGICTQCHCNANGSNYPNGASQGNSGEGLDFHSGFCQSQLSCVRCHDPHTAGPPEGAPASPSHLRACTSCHEQYQDEKQALAHSGHGAAVGVNCLDCHMPRIAQGLQEVVRTHRISMPVEETMITAGAPNACNLCHLDKSLNWTLDSLKKKWGRQLDPKSEWAQHYGGSLDNPVGPAWLGSPHSLRRLVAAHSYARSPLGMKNLPRLASTLNDPVPLNRSFGLFALERLTGHLLDQDAINITAPPAERQKQIDLLLQSKRLETPPDGPPAAGH